jgi:tetratricopeptide (TPR) repeat protein
MKTLFEKPVFWAKRFEEIAQWIILGTIALVPLIYFPFTFEQFELPKQSILLLGVILAWLLVVSARALNPQKTKRIHSSSIALVFLLIALGISALCSDALYLSWIGQSGLEAQSVLSFFLYALIFWYGLSCWKTESMRRDILIWLSVSAVAVGVIGFISLFIVAGSVPFTTAGTVNAFALFVGVMSLVVLGISAGAQVAAWKRWMFIVCQFLLPVLAVFFLLVLDYWAFWLVYLVGLLALLFMQAWTKTLNKKSLFPALLAVIGIVFLFFFATPFSLSVPTEVTPSFTTSWAVLTETLSSHSVLFGSGPGTFAFDYETYRPVDVNRGLFWETRFKDGFSFFFDFASTTGVFGFFSLLFFLFLIKAKTGITFFKKRRGKKMKESVGILPAWVALVTALCLFPANISLLLLLFVLSSLFAGVWAKEVQRQSKKKGKPSKILLFLFAVFCIGLVFMAAQRLVADTTYAKGIELDQQGAAFNEVLSKLDRAAYYNRFHDGYYRTLAESFIYQATSQIKNANGDLSDDQIAYIQSFLNAGINAAERAVALSPRQGLNWLVLGKLYQSFYPYTVSGIDSAQIAFDRLLVVEPANPAAWKAYGEMYLDAALYNHENKDVWLSLAEERFAHALALKPDYGPAGYKLANVYLAQGRTDAAIEMMAALHKTYPSDVTVVFELGMLYLERGQEGDYDLAGEAFANAITLMPTYANAYWYLASVYEGKGMLEQAIVELERVLTMDPANETVLARIAELEEGLIASELPASLEP